MTFFEFVKQCLQKEAARTETDSSSVIKQIIKEINHKWIKK